MSQQEFEATALPLDVLWILMTQNSGVCLHMKRGNPGVLSRNQVCAARSARLESSNWLLIKNPRSFSVHLLRGHFTGAAWGNNEYRWPRYVCMCLFDFFFKPKTLFRWVEEGTCTAWDVVNSLLCCSGLRKVLEASVSRYWEVAGSFLSLKPNACFLQHWQNAKPLLVLGFVLLLGGFFLNLEVLSVQIAAKLK